MSLEKSIHKLKAILSSIKMSPQEEKEIAAELQILEAELKNMGVSTYGSYFDVEKLE